MSKENNMTSILSSAKDTAPFGFRIYGAFQNAVLHFHLQVLHSSWSESSFYGGGYVFSRDQCELHTVQTGITRGGYVNILLWAGLPHRNSLPYLLRGDHTTIPRPAWQDRRGRRAFPSRLSPALGSRLIVTFCFLPQCGKNNFLLKCLNLRVI